MKRAKLQQGNKSGVTLATQQERLLSKEERYALIAEIAGTRRQAASFIDDAFRSHWHDR